MIISLTFNDYSPDISGVDGHVKWADFFEIFSAYGRVATISRLLKIVSLFCRISTLL